MICRNKRESEENENCERKRAKNREQKNNVGKERKGYSLGNIYKNLCSVTVLLLPDIILTNSKV